MIGKDEIAEAVRYADAIIEEHEDLPGFCRQHDIEIEGLSYVAMQCGLRAVMIEKGMNPNLTRPTPIGLTRAEQERQMRYAAMFMSGFITPFNLKEKP